VIRECAMVIVASKVLDVSERRHSRCGETTQRVPLCRRSWQLDCRHANIIAAAPWAPVVGRILTYAPTPTRAAAHAPRNFKKGPNP
jgi:hypothetical protein